MAPAFIALTASGTSPWPVMTMTGSREPRRFSSSCSSSPSMSGMRMSVTRQARSSAKSLARNAAADPKVLTRNPDASSRAPSESRTASSSSTTKTVSSAGILGAFRADGQLEAEDGAAARPRRHGDVAAMGLQDRLADHQADTHPRRLGGDEGLEQALGELGRYPRSGIRNGDFDIGVRGERVDSNFLGPATMQRLDGVAEEIDQHLLNLHAVHENRRQIGRQIQVELDVHVAGSDQRQRDGVLHDDIHVLGRAVPLPLLDEVPEAPNDLAGAVDLFRRLAQHLLDLFRLRPLGQLRELLGGIEIVAGGGERLVQLMRDGRG